MYTYLLNYNKRTLKAYQQLISAKNEAALIDTKNPFLNIGVMDPTIGTTNQGDYIIKDSVIKQLGSIFPESFLTYYPSQLHRGVDTLLQQRKTEEVLFVAGTNLLSSNMDNYYQWKVGPLDAAFLKNKYVLFGVGWWQYQPLPNKYTRWLYKSLLSTKYYHAVRDSYTQKQLQDSGIKNVLNTTCPTLWSLTPDRCQAIPTRKADDVVTTLTFYHQNKQKDKQLIDSLLRSYNYVYLWIQGTHDLNYLHELGYRNEERIRLVEPSLAAFDSVLQQDNVEYLGTRLHAGVRALQHGKRTLIVAVDNRALEISKDTNLNVIPRSEVEQMEDFIRNEYRTAIRLPQDTIDFWKNQFKQ